MKSWWFCGEVVVDLWWTCVGLVLDLWLSCGEVVVKNNSRFVPICGGTCGDIHSDSTTQNTINIMQFSPHL